MTSRIWLNLCVLQFEAGALVLSDGGICCIDELDKLSAEHQVSLLSVHHTPSSCLSSGSAMPVASLGRVLDGCGPCK